MLAQTALFILVLSFSLIEEKSLGYYQCVGNRREDRCYDFELPSDVDENVQTDACDAEWTVDQSFTAILEGNYAHFSHPFKNVTRHGISVIYCPVSVRFHVTCPKYTRDLTCSCTNATDNPVFSTLPSREISSSGLSKRQHYCAIAVAVSFVIIPGILAFFICRTNSTAKYAPTRASVDEQNHPA